MKTLEYSELIEALVRHMRQTGQSEQQAAAELLPVLLPQLSERGRRVMAEQTASNVSCAAFYHWLRAERVEVALRRLIELGGNC